MTVGESSRTVQPSGRAQDVREIRHNGVVVCTVVRRSLDPRSTCFLTGDESPLQVGLIVHPAGHVIPRHRHVPITRQLHETGEVLMVRSGRCIVELFTRAGELLDQVELAEGDVVILMGAAHRLTMQEDTVLFEVKQGPYTGPEEKEIF
jgi:cupin fold WbuC family metalloprotein